MRQTILFSAGYLSVPAIVYLTEMKLPHESVAICVEGRNLHKFLCYLNVHFWKSQVEIIYYPVATQSNKTDNISKIRDTFRRVRAVYDLFFRYKAGCDLALFARNYITDSLYYINRLRNINNIILMDILSEEDNGRRVSFRQLPFKQKLYWIYYRVIYGPGIEMNNLAGTYIPHLDDSYIAKYVKLVGYPQTEALTVFARYQKSFVAEFDMIFFDQNIDQYLTAEKEKFYDELSNLFTRLFKNRFAVKNHPEAVCGTIKENDVTPYSKLPQFIPGEFFLNSECKFYITYFSATLLNSPQAAGGNRIFLLDMMPFAEETSRQEIKRILLKSAVGDNIYFPGNFAELERILTGGEKCTKQLRE